MISLSLTHLLPAAPCERVMWSTRPAKTPGKVKASAITGNLRRAYRCSESCVKVNSLHQCSWQVRRASDGTLEAFLRVTGGMGSERRESEVFRSARAGWGRTGSGHSSPEIKREGRAGVGAGGVAELAAGAGAARGVVGMAVLPTIALS